MPHRLCKSHRTRTSRGHHRVFPTLWKNTIQIVDRKRNHLRTRINVRPPKSNPCLSILKHRRQTNGSTSPTCQTISTISEKSDNTSNSVATPNITQTRKEPQAKIQRANQNHDAHPHRPNIIEVNDGNQPQKLTHENQPLGLGLPPQRNTSTPHHIPPDFAKSPRVTPSPRVE